jgi:hypothetical protein
MTLARANMQIIELSVLFRSWKREHEFRELAEFCTSFGSSSDRRIASVVAISHAAPPQRTPNGWWRSLLADSRGQTEELDRNQLSGRVFRVAGLRAQE